MGFDEGYWYIHITERGKVKGERGKGKRKNGLFDICNNNFVSSVNNTKIFFVT